MPPARDALLKKFNGKLDHVLRLHAGPQVDGIYEHWDHLRHLEPPHGLGVEPWWIAIKLARGCA